MQPTAKTSDPLVSIITPTYNRAYCLPDTLDSALAQTHANVEIIVVDDGSTDNTREMLEQRYGHDPRVRYVYQENKRVAAARNLGLSLAQGDYVAFLDSDDRWDPWKLEIQVACLNRYPELGMVWTNMRAVDPDNNLVNERFLRTMYSAYRWFTNETLFDSSSSLATLAPALKPHIGDARFYWGDIYSKMIMGNMVHTSTVLLRRDRAQRVKEFNTKFQPTGEDYDFHLRTCREGPVGYLDLSTVDYQIGMADCLNRPSHKLSIAIYFLEVVERELREEHARIDLPQSMIRAVRAEAHEWIGYAHFLNGHTSQARTHFFQSLQQDIRQPRTLRLFAATFLKPAMLASARNVYHTLRPPKKSALIH